MNKKNKENLITHEGVLRLGEGKELPCYVLVDGTRVLSGQGMQEILKIVDGSTKTGDKLTEFLGRKSLKPFMAKIDDSVFVDSRKKGQNQEENQFNSLFVNKNDVAVKPLVCYKGDQKINGYTATSLVDICNIMLEARKHIELTPRQRIVAEQCEILVRSFAKVGIIALVDEATGYQYEREMDALQLVLKKFISEELLEWQKRFPDIFFREIFRLNGWDFSVKSIKKYSPSIIGKWINTLIYEQLPPGVLEEIKSKTPVSENGNKLARYHQWLSWEVGVPILDKQINKIITLFQLSDNMNDVWSGFEKMKSRRAFDVEEAETF